MHRYIGRANIHPYLSVLSAQNRDTVVKLLIRFLVEL